MKLRIKSEYFIDKTNKSFKIEDYLMVFEILISFNNSQKLSDILKIFHKMVEKEYLDKEIFNYFLRSGVFEDYAEKYLKAEQIDVKNIEEYIIKYE
ncbi:MAG: hypothetical protein PHG81_00165 [Aliarcobacter sp.]|nr:hypothetical protein [Aliarcobacter sp.]